MATTTLQHPTHDHPLLLDLSKEFFGYCDLCHRQIWAKAYTCHECWSHNYHRACVEAPPLIERHPLHPAHPLPLIHRRPAFTCDCCSEDFYAGSSSFWCDECNFDLDIGCALSTLSDRGGSQGGKTSEHITLPLHPHPLTSFSTRHDFVWDSNCYICRGSVKRDGYMCLRRSCEFIIHKGCIQDLQYADGTKAPCVYHGHPLETFGGDDAGSRTCSSCGSDESDEFIGCASCEVFYHRHCIQVPDILRYPSHHPDHTLVLFINCPGIDALRQCQSCSRSLENELFYRCTALVDWDENTMFSRLPAARCQWCQFFLHVGCALQFLTYCEEGLRARIELSWHKHPLYLCHRTKSASDDCSSCEDELTGPTYACNVEDCRFLLHRRCTEIKSTISHPHHPDHPLTLCERDSNDDLLPLCEACHEPIIALRFSCKRCSFNLHLKCAAHFPTQKHYLHEHKLLRFEEIRHLECSRCGTSIDSPFFRCVPCNFNLHEKCMELPQVVKSEIHWHPLTLHETFVEDDSGEYYCEHCEKRRDERLGVYVCGQCKISLPRIYHIECVLPELGKTYAKNIQTSAIKRIAAEITKKREHVRAAEGKLEEVKRELDEAKRELDELMKKQAELISKGGDPKNSV